MHCVFCKEPVNDGYVCDACHAEAETNRMARETLALAIKCPSCKAAKSVSCMTGSGKERSYHEVRLQRARKINA